VVTRLGHWLLKRCLSADDREALAGDLRQEFVTRIRPSRGWLAARAWLTWQVLAACAFAVADRLTARRGPGAALSGRLVESIWRDLRYAARLLLRSPGVTVTSVLTLALGMGASISVFAIVNGLVLRRLPVPAPEQVIDVLAQRPGGGYGAGFSVDEYLGLRDHARTVTALAAETNVAQLHVVTTSTVAEARGAFVTANYFSLMGVPPIAGRAFAPDEDRAGRGLVAVVSEPFWRTAFGGSPALGTRLRVNGVDLSLVGVMPPTFGGDDPSRGVDLWLPVSMLGQTGYGCRPGEPCASIDRLVGRLARRADLPSAQHELASSVVWTSALDVEAEHRRHLVVTPAGPDPDLRDALRPQLQLLNVVTTLLLLVVCANLAGLTLARDAARRRDLAIRLAVGASRARLVRQLFTESAVLAALGALCSLPVSAAGRDMLAMFYRRDPEGFLHAYDFGVDSLVYAYVLGLTLVAMVLVGVAPALRSTRFTAVADLRSGAWVVGRGRETRLGLVLVAAQMAVSVLLAVVCGLLSTSGVALTGGTNFDPSHVAVFRIRPALSHEANGRAEALVREASARLGALAGVESVGAMIGGEGLVWYWANGDSRRVDMPGRAPSVVNSQDVNPAFFDTLRIPVRAGRAFLDRDAATAPPVAIVNETLARDLWPGAQAVGRMLLVDGHLREVVGVVASLQPVSEARPPAPHLYLPLWQTPASAKGDVRFAVRVTGRPEEALPGLRALMRAIDASVPFGEDMPMRDQMQLEYGEVLLARRTVVFCGLFSLGLSAVGLYTVMALAVRRRTRELGVRMALGARPGQVTRQVLGSALSVTACGGAVGLAAAWLGTRALANWLYGVGAHDPASFIGASVGLLGVAAVAAYLPARRAARIDPLIACRTD
jgi:putative ABC transport system permease protein